MYSLPCRVLASHGHLFLVLTDTGEQLIPCAGRLSHFPVVGDFAIVRDGAIQELQPRRSTLARIAPGTARQPQILAANLDLLFVVSGLDGDFNVRRLERYLILAIESGAKPVFVLTKSDLCDDLETRLAETREIAAGFPIILSNYHDPAGAESIRSLITEELTGALIGSSGAGKSTLINLLLGENRQAVTEVRASDSRGRHTTTQRQMFRVPGGGWLIDQPGIREVQVYANDVAMAEAFPEIATLAAECRFRDCRHEQEPGCAVRAAVSVDRLASYKKLQRGTARVEMEDDVLTRMKQKNAIRRMHKAARNFYK